MGKPRILLLDLETSKILAKTFTLYPKAINHNDIVEDWYVICACWKWLGEKKVYSAKAVGHNDKNVIEKLASAIKQADIIVAHNGKKFDMKKYVSRLVFHNLPPIPYPPVVDTLTEIKKVASHTSHRLDYLGKFLLGEGKVDTEPGLWDKSMAGVRAAINKMVTYCIGDVILLERIYLRYRPYFKSHPHYGVLAGKDKSSCPSCGSTTFKFNGNRVSAAGVIKKECQCSECHSYFRIPITAEI